MQPPPPTRSDGRAADALRELSCEQGVLQDAMGSAQWQQGGSAVIVAVYGPAQPRYARLEKHDGCAVEVEFSSSSFGLRMSGALFHDSSNDGAVASNSAKSIAGNAAAGSTLEITPPEKNRARHERDMGAALRRTVQQCVMLERFPRQLLAVSCYVIMDDGAALACAINALTLALMNAGLPMRCCAAAVAVSQLADESCPLHIDPVLTEEAFPRVRYLATFAFACGAEGAEGDLVLMEVRGRMGADELSGVTGAARGAVRMVTAFMRLAVKEAYQLP